MEVLIDNRQKRHKISQQKIRQTVQVVLNALGCPDGEISILLVDDPQMEVMNREYLGRLGSTNVIAFPMREGQFAHINPQLLGDVVISMDTAAREAREAGLDTETRLDQLLVHGILHLLGYDHEKSAGAAREMESKTAELMRRIAAQR